MGRGGASAWAVGRARARGPLGQAGGGGGHGALPRMRPRWHGRGAAVRGVAGRGGGRGAGAAHLAGRQSRAVGRLDRGEGGAWGGRVGQTGEGASAWAVGGGAREGRSARRGAGRARGAATYEAALAWARRCGARRGRAGGGRGAGAAHLAGRQSRAVGRLDRGQGGGVGRARRADGGGRVGVGRWAGGAREGRSARRGRGGHGALPTYEAALAWARRCGARRGQAGGGRGAGGRAHLAGRQSRLALAVDAESRVSIGYWRRWHQSPVGAAGPGARAVRYAQADDAAGSLARSFAAGHETRSSCASSSKILVMSHMPH